MNRILEGKKAVVFDLDWTLYDAGDYYGFLWKELAIWAVAQGWLPLKEKEAYGLLIKAWEAEGPSAPDLFDRWLMAAGAQDISVVKQCVQFIHKERDLPIQPYKKMVELLEILGRKYSLALLTEGRTNTQFRKFRQLGLEPYFDFFLSTQEVGQVKLTGVPYNRVCSLLRVHPEETLSIGDTLKKDILPALEAGATAVWMRSNPFEKGEFNRRGMIQVENSVNLWTQLTKNGH